MIALTWLWGLLRVRRGRLTATTAGVAVAVALVASLGAFLAATTGQMTKRAIKRVAVDWQVAIQPGASARQALSVVRHYPPVRDVRVVEYAPSLGLRAQTGTTVQTTGPARIVGLPPSYARSFPRQLRLLAGTLAGPLLAQQTAANLHVKPGAVVTVETARAKAARVRIAGIVDLPAADALFQTVGAPPGAQAQAPPDNVVLLPSATFRRIEHGSARALVQTQLHVRIDHSLPASPNAAYNQVTREARNLETRLAGAGLVGDNLGATLDTARGDAFYAQLLFLFLALPGAVLAALITATIASAGADRRRRDAALLRTRGASSRHLLGLAAGEAALAGVAGSAAGLLLAAAIGKAEFGTASFGAGRVAATLWASGAALMGLAVAALAILVPAWRDLSRTAVAGQIREVKPATERPIWMRARLDLFALAGAAIVYWQLSRSGYQLVLAPEGVPQVSVNWYALLAPLLGWIGFALLVYRLSNLALARGRRQLARLLRPISGELATIVASSMARQRVLLARSLTMVALAAAFAGSTAIFNATFQQQSQMDALLTNGADVAVTESPGAAVSPRAAATLARVAGVSRVDPIQHRFAYVGPDLQDLYGVYPRRLLASHRLRDSWFAGGSAHALMSRLARHPDALLVSAETVRDFQLRPGDPIRLRLQDGRTKRLRSVNFRYAGVVKEFPTAPSDSFLVANADYVARATGSDAVGTFLVDTDGTSPSLVARRIRRVVGPAAQVTDIQTSRRVVGSNLTALEMSGLSRVELAFAVLLACAASGLALGIGFQERRRTYALAAALGARARQLAGFVWGEALLVTLGGLAAGALLAALLSQVLVKVLTGVFDPPPDALAVPWPYLAAVVVVVTTAVGAACALALRLLRRPAVTVLRDL